MEKVAKYKENAMKESKMEHALERLFDYQRFQGNDYNGYTLKEVAGKMKLSYSTVKLLHGMALKKLQKWM